MKYIVEVKGELPTYGAMRNAMPLVTCGECKNRKLAADGKSYFCNYASHFLKEQDYCSKGERREDEKV